MSTNAIELPTGSLIELTDHLQALFDTVEMIDDPAVLAEARAEIERYIEAEVRKVDSISNYISMCERYAGNLRAEIERMQQKVKVYDNRVERVRDTVKYVMQKIGAQKLEGQTWSFYLRPATPSVTVTDPSLLPDEFVRKTIKLDPDKRAIKEAIEAGHDVPGADLTLGGQVLVRR